MEASNTPDNKRKLEAIDQDSTALDAHATGSVADSKVKSNQLDAPLLVKRLSEYAQLPKRGSAQAAGYDLCSAHDAVVPAHGRAVVPTDLSIALPPQTYGRVAPRSGLAVKHFIDVGAGVVDRDYRGPLGIVLFNFGDEDFKISRGDRIAQLVIERIAMVDVVEVQTPTTLWLWMQDLDATQRGEGGFGSTGVSTSI
eukprot:jgi/Hompol1/6483/HPOL_005015-RA